MKEEIKTVFGLQQQHKFGLRKTDAKTRIGKLKWLKQALESAEAQLYAALETDLRKNRFESAVTELFFIYAEIDHAIKKLKGWMKPKPAGRSMSNLFARNKIYYEPKGVCLIIAPWNYPLQLIMSPLISAIAAGNCVILKPSELSGATADVISKLISDTFDVKEIACFEGDADVSTELLKLPFDHIFFTGSTAIGRVVMEAAAKNLSSVTLELGGKSPAIVDESCDLQKAADKIAWGKLVNAGQTCIAPDYVLIKENMLNDFVIHYKAAVQKMFFEESTINKNDYAKIINTKQFQRLNKLIEKALGDGAILAFGGKSDEQDLTITPTLLTSVAENSEIMQEEIFGPVLPVVTYQNLQEAIDLVNRKAKPLALYVFSDNTINQNKIISETSAGGTCVNDVLIHIGNPNLPFGGVNNSGIGSCHGIFGFKTFSHERAVVFQSKLGLTNMIYPPYKKKMGLLKWLKKLM
ncbi:MULTISPECIES: aldehyde dehydrogenase family protein [unclassified Pedobacter]|uniref:aldehyde dehydrogenase family protein n=1 Tax=unclassified Pedobacter TaxID=2628915 RepID=UPI00141E6F7C|nr:MULTISPECIES: aldehyde dehydrogenase family protein [unclassified Pedobacter]NII84412.1 aldehyde dehydrogenase (NAD+) [Pedobacter sp. SG908]NMN38673.1 aldehyde dehydrogenase (NAD+) [Pedobacter sp. SG918]